MKKFKGFTLAEIMIVLTVIGILTAILLPAAFHATPDENVMKFKKANSTLGTVIRELVNSDKYYLNGDLGIKPNGSYIDGKHQGDFTYFCETFADMLSTKQVKCSQETAEFKDSFYQIGTTTNMDTVCKKSSIGSEIISSDNITYFQTNPKIPFGIKWVDASNDLKENCKNKDFYIAYRPNCETTLLFSATSASVVDENNFGIVYKIFCIDVDGIPPNATADDCVNECPFGYGIRADGKILPGARATEWIEKSVQKED